jgi:aspartyl/asparaginyl-tRNA synthetase
MYNRADIAFRSNLTTGTGVEIIGSLVKSPGKEQNYEINAQNLKILGECDSSVGQSLYR